MPLEQKKQEKLVVVGGGITGVLTALFASRQLKDDGKPRYHVTLLESKDTLFKGASEAPHRLHLGGEYPLDEQTAVDCLWGAVLWKSLFGGSDVFTQEGTMRFLIAKATQEKAEAGDPDSVSLEKHLASYERLRQEYIRIIDLLYQQVPPELPPPGGRTSQYEAEMKQRIAAQLFGAPEVFYERLTAEELAPYGGRVIGGFKTQEPGIHLPRFLAALEKTLRKSDVTVLTEKHVERYERGDAAALGQGGTLWQIHCRDSTVHNADMVIQAAWEGGLELDSAYRQDNQQVVQAYRRGMAIVDISGLDPTALPPPSFVLKDEHGGMFCPINSSYAVVYHPKLADLAPAYEMDSSRVDRRRIPDHWQGKLSEGGKASYLALYKAALVGTDDKSGIFPFLKNAGFVDLIEQRALNFQRSKDERRHEPLKELAPGLFTIYATKGTLAPRSALEAVEAAVMRSLRCTPADEKVRLDNIREDYLLLATKQRSYQLAPLLKEEIIEFLIEHGMSLSAGESTGTTPRPYMTPDEAVRRTDRRQKEKDAASKRRFGQGFGQDKVTVYTESSPRTGNLFAEDDALNLQYCRAVKKWADEGCKEPLTTALEQGNLDLGVFARALANRLLHSDTTALIQIAGQFRYDWKDIVARDHLFGPDNILGIPEEVWNRIISSRPRSLPEWKELREHPEWLTEKLRTDPELAGALLPFLYSILPVEDQVTVAKALAETVFQTATSGRANTEGLDRQLFEVMGDPEINRVQIHSSATELSARSIENNGRSIRINWDNPAVLSEEERQGLDSYIEFQGRRYYPAEFHFHRTRNIARIGDEIRITDDIVNDRGESDGELEYTIYRNPEEENLLRSGASRDPNHDSVGELHAIFMHVDPETGYKKALALCAHVKLGEHNEALGRYTDILAAREAPLARGEKMPVENVHFTPMDCFPTRFDKHGICETAFTSLYLGGSDIEEDNRVRLSKSSSDLFYNGVEVLILGHDEAAHISPGQMEVLQQQLPQFQPLERGGEIKPLVRIGYPRGGGGLSALL